VNRLVGRSMTHIAGNLRADADLGHNQVGLGVGTAAPLVSASAHIVPALVELFDPTLQRCAVCGDRMIEPPETCDDGNMISGDGCSSTCQVEAPATATPSPSATPTTAGTPMATATPSPTPTLPPCSGDCDGNGSVALAEILIGINIALDVLQPNACPAFAYPSAADINPTLVQAVRAALSGCAARR